MTLINQVLQVHVCCAAAGLLSGFRAMVFRKGSGLHGAAGTIFFISMLIATCAGAIVAGILRPNSVGMTWGIEAVRSATGSKDHYPAPFFFVFGSIALLFAASDVRMLVRRGIFGAQRIARHLFRMCMAFLFALLSFYPGQTRFFSKALRETNLPYVPHVLVAGAMLFALYRVAVRKRVPLPQGRTV